MHKATDFGIFGSDGLSSCRRIAYRRRYRLHIAMGIDCSTCRLFLTKLFYRLGNAELGYGAPLITPQLRAGSDILVAAYHGVSQVMRDLTWP